MSQDMAWSDYGNLKVTEWIISQSFTFDNSTWKFNPILNNPNNKQTNKQIIQYALLLWAFENIRFFLAKSMIKFPDLISQSNEIAVSDII